MILVDTLKLEKHGENMLEQLMELFSWLMLQTLKDLKKQKQN